MGMSLKDYAVACNNTQGKYKDPKTKLTTIPKSKICIKCGFEIKSAIVRSLYFKGDHCIDCVKCF